MSSDFKVGQLVFMKPINWSLPLDVRWNERLSHFKVGQLVMVVAAHDQGWDVKQLVEKRGLIIKHHDDGEPATMFAVLIDEKIYDLHVLDMEPAECS